MTSQNLTYFNGVKWYMIMFPDGARAVWPCRMDGTPLPGAKTHFYRKPAAIRPERLTLPAAA